MLLLEGVIMDTKKLCELLMNDDSIKDIPAIHVLRVACAILQIMESGECFFDAEEKTDVC